MEQVGTVSHQLPGCMQQKERKEIDIFVVEVICYMKNPDYCDGSRLLSAPVVSSCRWLLRCPGSGQHRC